MIHVLFCSSAAGSLRQALRTRGCPEKVVDLTEFLDWGPIGADDFEERSGWLDRNLPCKFEGGWNWIVEHVAEFRASIEGDDDRLIWVQPQSAPELSGLYWYAECFGSSSARMLIVPPYKSMIGLGVRDAEAMGHLLDNSPREAWDENRFPANRWRELRQENALLRIVNAHLLRSAPCDYFDDLLLKRCSGDWAEWMRVVGNAMSDVWDAGHKVDDLFIQWRLRDLIRRELVEANGDLPLHGEQAATQIKLAH